MNDEVSHPLLGLSSLSSPGPTPLPTVQLAAVYAIKLIIPIASFQHLPYINQWIDDLHLSGQRSTGYYSGLLDSAFTLAQLLSVYPWARLSGPSFLYSPYPRLSVPGSDRIGRVPVVVVGTLGLAAVTLLFGLSTSFTSILITRCLST
jgi:MFS family permease